jgi:hypothetical protein
MGMNKNIVLAGGTLIMFLLISTSIAPTAIANGQNTNRQITSSNTNNDYNSWERFSMYTDQPFHFGSATGAFDFQMNTRLNGCAQSQVSCTWWMQGVVVVANHLVYPPSKGAFVIDGFTELWVGVSNGGNCDPTDNCINTCYVYPATNVNYTGYATVEQTKLLDAQHMQYILTIVNSNGVDIYQATQNCPAYPTGYGPINFFSREEGAIVGDGAYINVNFSPSGQTIFYGYIDLVSNYNKMTSACWGTQTGETSNLYQVTTSHFGETYGSMYLYTVMSNENTRSSACT